MSDVADTPTPILEIENLRVSLPKGADRPYALDGLNLTVNPGETPSV